jgi:hypothetical protein
MISSQFSQLDGKETGRSRSGSNLEMGYLENKISIAFNVIKRCS